MQQLGHYIFSVHELTRYIKTTLEREPTLSGVLVRGEISNCKYHSSGHLYFTLKDENSQLPCVMWRDRVRTQSFQLENGMHVTAEGSITVYDRGGYYQLNAYSLQVDGVGNLYLAFEQLKQKLAAEGLFDRERKRPLPMPPRRIALIASPTGAVIHDFMTIASRRWRGRHIVVIPTSVQGPQAPASITHALQVATEIPDIDVIVLARGGGSFEELACFNDERVARAIAASPIPVVSAIGHETDFTIADFVADLRAPTPSAAAELVIPDLQGIDTYLNNIEQRIYSRTRALLAQRKRDVSRAATHPAISSPLTLIRERQQTIDLISERIYGRLQSRLQQHTVKLHAVENVINALDPRGVLLRGYSIVMDHENQRPVLSAVDALEEKKLHILFADGTVPVEVR